MAEHIKWLVENRIEIAKNSGKYKINFVGKYIEKDKEIYDRWKEEVSDLSKWMEEDLDAVVEGRCHQIVGHLRGFFYTHSNY